MPQPCSGKEPMLPPWATARERCAWADTRTLVSPCPPPGPRVTFGEELPMQSKELARPLPDPRPRDSPNFHQPSLPKANTHTHTWPASPMPNALHHWLVKVGTPGQCPTPRAFPHPPLGSAPGLHPACLPLHAPDHQARRSSRGAGGGTPSTHVPAAPLCREKRCQLVPAGTTLPRRCLRGSWAR